MCCHVKRNVRIVLFIVCVLSMASACARAIPPTDGGVRSTVVTATSPLPPTVVVTTTPIAELTTPHTAVVAAPTAEVKGVPSASQLPAYTPAPAGSLSGRIVFLSNGSLYIVGADCGERLGSCDQDAIQVVDPQVRLLIDLQGGMTASPDGRKIAFVSRQDNHASTRSRRGIYVLDIAVCTVLAEGCSKEKLVRLGQAEAGEATDDFAPAWSPQGDRLLFSREYVNTINPPILYEVQADGAREGPLFEGSVPDVAMFDGAWSPDGMRLVVAMSVHNFPTFIALVNLENGTFTELVRPQHDPVDQGYRRPRWAPHGDKIIFEADSLTTTTGYSINVDGSGLIHLPINNAPHHFAWSPDGLRIAYVAFAPSKSGEQQTYVYLANRDGSQQQQLVTQRPAQDVLWIP